MKIEIKLFATLKKYLPPDADGSSATIEVKDGLTVAGLIEHLKIPKELAQLVLVNGVNIEGDYGRKLQEEDTVSIFPPVAGGSSKLIRIRLSDVNHRASGSCRRHACPSSENSRPISSGKALLSVAKFSCGSEIPGRAPGPGRRALASATRWA